MHRFLLNIKFFKGLCHLQLMITSICLLYVCTFLILFKKYDKESDSLKELKVIMGVSLTFLKLVTALMRAEAVNNRIRSSSSHRLLNYNKTHLDVQCIKYGAVYLYKYCFTGDMHYSRVANSFSPPKMDRTTYLGATNKGSKWNAGIIFCK